MHYSSIILAALAATGSVAAPWGSRAADNSIVVFLSDQATETGSQTSFTEGQREQKGPVGSGGPFQTVELRLGKAVKKQDLRCQVLDERGEKIELMRGGNTDTTFGDGDKGEWTFKKRTTVSSIICDPTFVKAAPKQDSNVRPGSNADGIRVTLSNQATETGSQTTFTEGKPETKTPVGSSGPFETVELTLSNTVQNKDLRCQILDNNGNAITVIRGTSVDKTFGDGGKGKWTLQKVTEVSKIICDPSFKKGPAP
ncbi:MAG: hypothetical protein M1813_006640 [Trichoglossum hirsutum]|nr:MAG: hypothetical protein M1813_006640 [Trichoglossum hirsutum]